MASVTLPVGNYYYADITYSFKNPYTKEVQRFYVQDYRSGFKKDGMLMGLPVIRIINPKDPNEQTLLRPYYLIDGWNKIKVNPKGDKIICFFDAIKDYRKREEDCFGEICTLQPVHNESIGPKEKTAEPKKEEKKE